MTGPDTPGWLPGHAAKESATLSPFQPACSFVVAHRVCLAKPPGTSGNGTGYTPIGRRERCRMSHLLFSNREAWVAPFCFLRHENGPCGKCLDEVKNAGLCPGAGLEYLRSSRRQVDLPISGHMRWPAYRKRMRSRCGITGRGGCRTRSRFTGRLSRRIRATAEPGITLESFPISFLTLARQSSASSRAGGKPYPGRGTSPARQRLEPARKARQCGRLLSARDRVETPFPRGLQ